MAIVCTGNGQDEAITNIVTSIAARTMYNLLLEHNATGEAIKEALMMWFSTINKMAAIDFSEYDSDTERVSFQDKIEGEEISS